MDNRNSICSLGVWRGAGVGVRMGVGVRSKSKEFLRDRYGRGKGGERDSWR